MIPFIELGKTRVGTGLGENQDFGMNITMFEMLIRFIVYKSSRQLKRLTGLSFEVLKGCAKRKELERICRRSRKEVRKR